jgi:hypothetical protein
MATSKVTNGEYYDHERQTWMQQCGATAVPIRKLDKDSQPVAPPELEATSENN